MQLEKRVKHLEQVHRGRLDADVLLDFRWDGPDPRNKITFKIDGHGVVDQLPGETDDSYRARAFELCRRVCHSRGELPTIKIFLPG